MMFCPKCGSIMTPEESSGKLVCSCGYEIKPEETEIKEKNNDKKEIIIIEEEHSSNPIVEKNCPECGFNKAEFWTLQTRASDEPETTFYKCKKCGHTWREY